jgi:hypothetical protein
LGASAPLAGLTTSQFILTAPPVGRFGKNVYIQTTLHKFEERLPFARIGSVFERSGLKISAPAELELLWRTSNWLRPKYEEILSSVRNSRVVYTDQTGIKVDDANFCIWDLTRQRYSSREGSCRRSWRRSRGRDGEVRFYEVLKSS